MQFPDDGENIRKYKQNLIWWISQMAICCMKEKANGTFSSSAIKNDW